jgi:hypothetical protein
VPTCVEFGGGPESDQLSSRPMENALYYTLSTIAQTLAGALAILVAAVLFRLSALARERELVAEVFDANSIDSDVYLPMAMAQGYDAMVAGALEAGFNIAQNQRLRRRYAAATEADQAWSRITLRLFLALTASVITIAVCFVALPFTPRLAASQSAPCVLAIAVGLGIVCLLLYVWLIVATVRRRG